ncbi:DUF2797 domain-containing protein [Fluviicola sp.]|jgi:hypothetical protein|uniref:DUF2797 domain-containing protein n=1 Tax=Fluviicola sp. TaxID=1917219 RepID=UPI002834F026|nr:DUF2797 domain-containing protein [Fluviicola sp.]MDR0801108.1 DUF2797 domain-containing protein [Fluviicola sp.]
MKGLLDKMWVSFDNPVQYRLVLDHEALVAMNELISREIQLSWTGRIICSNCGKLTKTSFGQGFCFNCFQTAPQAAPCIINPELCRAHLGEGRNIEWEEKHHNQPHIVYLAASDSVKVGVTRAKQKLTRWIDQGASQAIVLAETANRYEAGLIEVALKSVMTDKTNWQRMLKNEIREDVDLLNEKGQAEDLLPFDLRDFVSMDDSVTELIYPVEKYPLKVKSVGFDKTPVVSGKLAGIKGQYLIFDDERVINLRKHTSYEIEFTHE